MNVNAFIGQLVGKKWRHTRTHLALMEKMLDEFVQATVGPVDGWITLTENGPDNPAPVDYWLGDGLFTEEHGVLVAVIETGAGHLYCDRFVEVKP